MLKGDLDELLYAKEARDHAAVDLAEHVGEVIRICSSEAASDCLNEMLCRHMRDLHSLYYAKAERFEDLLDKYEQKVYNGE